MNLRKRLGSLAAGLGLAACACTLPVHAQTVEIKTSMGAITAELYPDKAPKTVANFLQYVKDKHYDGTIFHRVIPTFMIQGGGFMPDMKEKNTRPPIQHEGREALAKGAKNDVGTLAMARTGDPHSATAQFFINVKDNDFLNPTLIPPGDPVPRFEFGGRVYENVPRANLLNSPQLWGYTVFGKVTKGMDVVEKIKAVPTGQSGPFSDVPASPVVIESIRVLDAPKKAAK
jgi:peptidyl-prolyl cis-trans isomerase A (cyclophilin A)